jgi:DNA polymerase-3 subunit chi
LTQVDFHFNVPDKLQYGCRLVRKVRQAGHRILVWCDDEARLAEFDRQLWTFSDDFIPHVMASDPIAPDTPVLLSSEAPDTDHHEVMINLGNRTPPTFSRFDRLIELVSADDADRERARERYRFYRDRGYPLRNHDVAGRPAGGAVR